MTSIDKHREIMRNARSADTVEERDYWLMLGDAAADDIAWSPELEITALLIALVFAVAFTAIAIWAIS